MAEELPAPMSVDVSEQDGIVIARVRGVIDEYNTLAKQLSNVGRAKVLIDVGGVERINSVGVKDWILWMQALEGRNNTLFFSNVSPAMVLQVNMLWHFFGQGAVLNFQAPYHCPKCGRDYRETFTPQTITGVQAPAKTCKNCGSALDFDDVPEAYFLFAHEFQGRPVPPEVAKRISA